jgi:hypothetical protein
LPWRTIIALECPSIDDRWPVFETGRHEASITRDRPLAAGTSACPWSATRRALHRTCATALSTWATFRTPKSEPARLPAVPLAVYPDLVEQSAGSRDRLVLRMRVN